MPTLLSTISICIVFVPVFLLQGTAKYLFSPLSLSVCVSLIASLALSFTLVPVLFADLMRSTVAAGTRASHGAARRAALAVQHLQRDPSRLRERLQRFPRRLSQQRSPFASARPAVTGAVFLRR